MRPHSWLLGSALLLALAVPAIPAGGGAEAPQVTWKKTVVDRAFRSEGVAIADVNRDGKMDILVGDVWYEAPDWKVHEIRPPGNYGDGAAGYSKSFGCFADDFNHDGWPDLIVIPFPGEACYWYENPQGRSGHWKEHLLWRSACNETPQYADLFGDGKKKLIMAIQPEGQMCWFEPGPDPSAPWVPHPISDKSTKDRKTPGTERFSHGLGVGDLNGDGRLDVICTEGWWEQPAKDDGKPWKFHPAKLGAACADMFAYDMDGDGKADVVSSSAHFYGMWWYHQRAGKDGVPQFVEDPRFILHGLVSETHALHCVDINGDGLKDLVTGKRWWAHGPTGDMDPMAPADLYWFEAKRAKDGQTRFVIHRIDDDSGVGTQFVVADINGDKLPDIVVANKKGVFVFEQVRGKGK
jgi:hypothetical protein